MAQWDVLSELKIAEAIKQGLQESMREKHFKGQLQLKSLGYISGGYTSELYDYITGSGVYTFIHDPEIAKNFLPILTIDYKISLKNKHK